MNIGRRKINTRFQLETGRPRQYTSHDVFLITDVTGYQPLSPASADFVVPPFNLNVLA